MPAATSRQHELLTELLRLKKASANLLQQYGDITKRIAVLEEQIHETVPHLPTGLPEHD